jgi:hypothetical protein
MNETQECFEIIKIYEPYLYSVKYEGEELSEFDRLFQTWGDVTYVNDFMEANKSLLESPVWERTHKPEEAARQVLKEAYELEEYFHELCENAETGMTPDLDSHFHFLNGKYKYVCEWIPMKSYGTIFPSFLRIYAIKLKENVYIITGGGIKLSKDIQSSPDIKDHVIKNIDRVRRFLVASDIIDDDDMK